MAAARGTEGSTDGGGGLEQLFAALGGALAEGRRGPDLGARFRAAFDEHAAAHLDELGRLVAAGLRGLGLADWSGARLGPELAGHPRLGDPACVAELTLALAVGEADAGLGWLGGPLFASGRLVAYLRAAEEDPGKAMAYLTRNVKSELQARRRAADPEGAALFDDLAEAGRRLAAEGAARVEGRELLLEGPGPSPRLDPAAAADELRAAGALDPFLAAIERNATRATGRNTPLRGAPFVEPLVPALAALGPGSLDLSSLANHLRAAWPLPPEQRTAAMPTDDDDRPDPGALGPDPAAPDPAALAEAGPAVLAALLDPWRAALAEAPGLGDARRGRLEGYLDELDAEMRATLGDLPATWRADLRRRLGIKPQTWSDDWQLLGGLLRATLEQRP